MTPNRTTDQPAGRFPTLGSSVAVVAVVDVAAADVVVAVAAVAAVAAVVAIVAVVAAGYCYWWGGEECLDAWNLCARGWRELCLDPG